jgi:signal peptidase II
MKNYFRITLFFFLLVSLDQISKIIFFENSVCNKNIAWGIPIAPAIFYSAWTAVIVALVYIFFKAKKQIEKIFLTLILAGAFSNVIDRARFGCVVDFIDLKFFPASIAMRSIAGWPVFNLADVYISIGVLLVVVAQIKKYKIPDTKY